MVVARHRAYHLVDGSLSHGFVGYYTAKGDYVYAFYMPAEGENLPAQVDLGTFTPVSSKGVSLLGTKRALKWNRTSEGTLSVQVPKSVLDKLPCDHIWCFKIKVK